MNNRGQRLPEICKILDLILNSRCKGDSLGKITFHGKQGLSSVDYNSFSHEILHMFFHS